MKFNNVKNIFTPEITKFELSEKEIEYISMLASGVDKKRVMKILLFNYAQIRKLYVKLGLTDKTKKRDVQAVTLFAINNLISKELLMNIYKTYNVVECKELAEN